MAPKAIAINVNESRVFFIIIGLWVNELKDNFKNNDLCALHKKFNIILIK